MSIWERWKPFLVFGPILGLVALGVFLSVRSGVVNLTRGKDLRRLIANLTGVLLRVAVYIVALLAVQRIVGFPIHLSL